MTPLLWLAVSAAGRVIDTAVPPDVIGDIPSYVFDKHTAAGKAAIHRFARENAAVRDAIAAFVPEYRALDAACMAAFQIDAAPVSRRFEWTGSTELERLGVEADMTNVGVPVEGIAPLLTVVRDNLDCLNTIRADLLARRSALTVMHPTGTPVRFNPTDQLKEEFTMPSLTDTYNEAVALSAKFEDNFVKLGRLLRKVQVEDKGEPLRVCRRPFYLIHAAMAGLVSMAK